MKPVNTFSSELLRKLSKNDNYEGLNADQVMLSMMENPLVWYNIPLIFIDKRNDSIRKILGTPKGEKHIALVDLFEPDGSYKLEPYLAAASSTNNPSYFEKDFLKTHEKFFLLNSALSGSILRIFPLVNDANNKWIAPPEVNEANYKGMDSLFTRQIIPLYRNALVEARNANNYESADTFLNGMKNFQKKHGSAILPSKEKIETEILYNKYDIFRKLYVYYMLAGLLVIIISIVFIFWNNDLVRTLVRISKVLVLFLFVVHTGCLLYTSPSPRDRG